MQKTSTAGANKNVIAIDGAEFELNTDNELTDVRSSHSSRAPYAVHSSNQSVALSPRANRFHSFIHRTRASNRITNQNPMASKMMATHLFRLP